AMAVQRATGYREFKTSDGYRNDVMAVVALRLGAVERRGTSLADHTFRSPPLKERRQLREYALFHVGAHLCAVSSDHVLEALPCDRLVRTPRAHPLHAGLLEVGMGAARQFITVMCARQMMALNYPARTDDGVVLVFNGLGAGRDPTQPLMGLRVDGVAQVLDLDASRLQALPSGIRRMSPWTAGILELHTPDGAPVLLQVLDASAMLDLLALPGLASSAEAGDGQQASSHEGSPADEPAFG
ncbi:MAG: chemotaxis protein CheW, partial [Rubrivivax sp.]